MIDYIRNIYLLSIIFYLLSIIYLWSIFARFTKQMTCSTLPDPAFHLLQFFSFLAAPTRAPYDVLSCKIEHTSNPVFEFSLSPTLPFHNSCSKSPKHYQCNWKQLRATQAMLSTHTTIKQTMHNGSTNKGNNTCWGAPKSITYYSYILGAAKLYSVKNRSPMNLLKNHYLTWSGAWLLEAFLASWLCLQDDPCRWILVIIQSSSSSSRWQQVMQQCDHSKLEEQREGGVPEHHIHIVFSGLFFWYSRWRI